MELATMRKEMEKLRAEKEAAENETRRIKREREELELARDVPTEVIITGMPVDATELDVSLAVSFLSFADVVLVR